ncbi:TetR/AcrR family transcriptional regulator [Streptomyces sp. NPDC091280]|uniref:TetR/AcrR family transcriptional regulator n=1 Tax=Streptomyces sp. NPDC091280 TaxID=3365984 RepID=UPI003823F9BE
MGGTMVGSERQRRGNTRQRIQDLALELFAEQGYAKTSLREIAERLDVTKAALYYHFKTKEEILVSVFEDLIQPIEELIEWGRGRPHTLETKREIIRRYSEALTEIRPLVRFMQENQATVKELRSAEQFRNCILSMRDILIDPDTALVDQIRCVSAAFTLHISLNALNDLPGTDEDKRKAALEVATALVTQAHRGMQAS